jgi:hypothetical protein
MSTILVDTGGYRLVANLTPLARPAGQYRLHLTSTLDSAKNPLEAITVADLILDEAAVHRLASALIMGAKG